ncbi:two-component sensor histidine kinase [Novosphingobium hassiacum]|uniref:Two-component sensor histidine kinase n=1 Tax=Novosphingobium hassiacum TaxID=173676 RepID=A0A7W5ZU06_9SPHN|nr:two-component sensor histidine kinase [Novosphingobium hassiacum]
MTSSQIDPGVPRVPARQVILSAAALWLCYFLLITVRGLVVELGDFSDLLWRRAAVTGAGIVVTVACWPLLRRFDGRSLAVRGGAALVIMLPAALALAAVNQWAFAPVEQRMIERISQRTDTQTGATDDTQADTRADSGDEKTVTVRSQNGTPGVQIRHDMAGNVLVDMLDESFIPPEPPPPPPAPRASAAPRAAAAPSAPRASPVPRAMPRPEPIIDDETLAELEAMGERIAAETIRNTKVVNNEDGSMVITQPGLIVRRFADGTSEVRTGGYLIRSDADDEVQSVEPIAEPEPPAPPQTPKDPSLEASAAVSDQKARISAEMARATADRARVTAQRTAERAIRDAQNIQRVRQRVAQRIERAKPAEATAPDVPEPSPSEAVTEDVRGADHVTIIRKSVESEGLWRQLTDVALGRYFLLIAWAALYLALGNGEQLRAAEYREGLSARAAKAAELRSLRYQVNPHFLFNTLNSLSALVMVGRAEQAERMIQSISRFYRHSLAGDPTSDMPLEDEIALQRHYLDIEAVRFPERLRCEFDVPEDLMTACVPGMILQPLVENSIKYAVSTTIRPVTIRITAREGGGFLVLTVADDGPGEGFVDGGTGIGLANVRSRLAARFGDAAKVESGPLPAGGYATVLTVPIVRNDC